jgi:mRNA interferase MazF
VSNDAANRTVENLGRGAVTVVPLTSNVDRTHPFQVFVAAGDGGLSTPSKAQAEQVRAVAYDRLRRHLGTLKTDTVRQVDGALRLHLGL